MREVCGAVSGMFMAAGIKYGYSDPKNMNAKKEHYRLIQTLAERFKERNKYIVCRQLLGMEADGYTPSERNGEYYKKRPCAELVRDAAEIFEEYLECCDKKNEIQFFYKTIRHIVEKTGKNRLIIRYKLFHKPIDKKITMWYDDIVKKLTSPFMKIYQFIFIF